MQTYFAIGHVCVDLLHDRPERLGGTVFFSAGQAAAMGCAVTVVTSCTGAVAAEARTRLPAGTALQVHPADRDTRFEFGPDAELGPQRLASAAPKVEGFTADALPDIVHLAPIFDEIGADLLATARDRARFVGATPQGLLRGTDEEGRLVFRAEHWPNDDDFADAIVLNDDEFMHLADLGLLDRFGGWVFRTLGPAGAALYRGGVEVARSGSEPATAEVVAHRTIGAGDVFAAAAFVALARGDDPHDALATAVRSATGYVRRGSDEPAFVDGTR